MYAHPPKDLDLLSVKLRRVQAEYERARSRGDAERIHRFRLQMGAIVAERDRLIRHLSLAGGSRPQGARF
jgi:hypothetical protein